MSHSDLPHIHVCGHCGSLYTVTSQRVFHYAPRSQKVAPRAADPVACEVCGRDLMASTGTRVWSIQLLRRGSATASSGHA